MPQPATAARFGPDCYRCVHRRGIPGDTHSRCDHPVAAAIGAEPLAKIVGLMRGPPVLAETLGVVGHPHGIRQGWFSWPRNFDPVWLQACNGFLEMPAETPK